MLLAFEEHALLRTYDGQRRSGLGAEESERPTARRLVRVGWSLALPCTHVDFRLEGYMPPIHGHVLPSALKETLAWNKGLCKHVEVCSLASSVSHTSRGTPHRHTAMMELSETPVPPTHKLEKGEEQLDKGMSEAEDSRSLSCSGWVWPRGHTEITLKDQGHARVQQREEHLHPTTRSSSQWTSLTPTGQGQASSNCIIGQR